MKGRILAILMLCLMLGACSEETKEPVSSRPADIPPPNVEFTGKTPEDTVKNVIVRYNQLLVYGYERMNMNPLQEVASVRMAEKAYYHMAAIGEGGVRMTSRLKKINFTVSFPRADRALVKTRELWDFAYNDISTGAKREEAKDVAHLMEYTLENQNGRWLLIDITTGSEEKPRQAVEPRRFDGDRHAVSSPPVTRR